MNPHIVCENWYPIEKSLQAICENDRSFGIEWVDFYTQIEHRICASALNDRVVINLVSGDSRYSVNV